MTPPRYRSKIQDAARRHPGRGSFGDLGPGELALAEWQALGLELPDLQALRAYRLARLRAQLAARDYAGIVVCDPANIRYATDAANMQVWCLHNPARYAFVATEGPVILFDFHGCAHLSAPLELVDEVRPARAWYFFNSGGRVAEHARLWAAEIADLVQAHGGGNRRLAIDKADPAGAAALEAQGLALHDGQEVMELARAIKSADEIRAMRCALATCEAAMAGMRQHLRPGISEQQLGRISTPRTSGAAANGSRPAFELRPPHQPLVPGVQQPRDRGGRSGRLRHRPDRPLRLLRRYFPNVALRRGPGELLSSKRSTASPASRSPTTWT